MIDFCSNCGHIDVLKFFQDNHKFCSPECRSSFVSFIQDIKKAVVV